MIVDFKTKAKSFWKLYMNTFCPKFNPQTPEQKIYCKLKKEEYIVILGFIMGFYIIDLLEFIFGSLGFFELIAFTLMDGFLLLCARRGKLEFIKIFFCIISSTIEYFCVVNDMTYILSAIVFLAILPSISFILTRSLKKSMIVYSINLMQSVIIFKPLIEEILDTELDYLKSKMLIPFISISFSLGLLMIIIYWILFNSRRKMVATLIAQKRNGEFLNGILTERNQELKDFADKRYNLLLSVSHEVRNPLNIISGTTELALIDETSPSVVVSLETIKTSSDLMTYFINNLLDYSKLDKYELFLCPNTILITKLMEDIWNSSKILIKKKGLFGQMFVSKNMPKRIKIDEKRIMQIIYNLVGNSSKFTIEGYIGIICTWINKNDITKNMTNPTNEDAFRSYLNEKSKILKPKLVENTLLEISKSHCMLECSGFSKEEFYTGLSRQRSTLSAKFGEYFIQKVPKTLDYKKLFDKYDILTFDQIRLPFKEKSLDKKPEPTIKKEDKENYLKIEIIDSGCGIRPEYSEEIFKKFTQVGTETQNRLGTGLGLWIAKNICKLMDGELKCHSSDNIGTIFVAFVKCQKY